MVQRAAACASSPDGFMALFRELVLSASAPPARPEQEGDRPVSDPNRTQTLEEQTRSAFYWANRREWKKAWNCFNSLKPADGRSRKVVDEFINKTPQAKASPEHAMRDEPGYEAGKYKIKPEIFARFVRSCNVSRAGGPNHVDYDFVRIITDSERGSKCLLNYFTAFSWGVEHPRLQQLDADLKALCLVKEDGSLRPLGMCSIMPRSAERCIHMQESAPGWSSTSPRRCPRIATPEMWPSPTPPPPSPPPSIPSKPPSTASGPEAAPTATSQRGQRRPRRRLPSRRSCTATSQLPSQLWVFEEWNPSRVPHSHFVAHPATWECVNQVGQA